MSSLALMRWLESAPARYDAGMRWLTLGRVGALRDAAAAFAVPAPGARVLEVGCGTGALTELLVERGARVTALDANAAMLELARERLAGAPVEWLERSASEIDALPEAGFDAVVAGFSLSEMALDERRFVLREAARRLRPGGRLAVADEVRPRGARRMLHALLRAPQAALAWLLAGSTSRPLVRLPREIEEAGLAVNGEQCWLGGALALVAAERTT